MCVTDGGRKTDRQKTQYHPGNQYTKNLIYTYLRQTYDKRN